MNPRDYGCFCGGEVVTAAIESRTIPDDQVYTYTIRVCRACGTVISNTGKNLPPNSGWDFPGLPRRVFVWQNGAIMVFDDLGQQCGNYQCLIGQGNAREVALDRIVPRDRWEYRMWPGREASSLAGLATPEWLAGRAGQINRHFGLPQDDPQGRDVAEVENNEGQLLIGAIIDWKGAVRYGRTYDFASAGLHGAGAPAGDEPPGEGDRQDGAGRDHAGGAACASGGSADPAPERPQDRPAQG